VKSAGVAVCLLTLLAVGVSRERPHPAKPPPATPSAGGAELPRIWLDTSYGPPSGRTLAVRAGGDLQAALDEAQPGDVITLEAGATFRGPFTLRRKRGQEWITVRTSASDDTLPPPGARVIVGAPKGVRCPPGNFFPGSFQDVGFLDLAGRDYRLSPSSPFHRAGTDGRDIGADLDALPPALQAAQGRDPGRIASPGRGEGSPGRARP